MLRQNSKLPPRLARYHPLGEGYGQARSVLGPEQGTEQGKLPWHATKELQQNPEPSQYKEKSAELQQNTWTHQASHVDSDKHPIRTALPAPLHLCHDSDYTNSLNGKYRRTGLAPWSARHHPFEEGHGLAGTVFGPVQGSEHGMQFLANEELQIPIPHQTQESEERPRYQTRTRQINEDIQS